MVGGADGHDRWVGRRNAGQAGWEVIGLFVMLYGIAFVTIFVAAITSIFVARAAAERGMAGDQAEQRIEAKLDVLDQRLDRLDGIDERLARLEELLRR